VSNSVQQTLLFSLFLSNLLLAENDNESSLERLLAKEQSRRDKEADNADIKPFGKLLATSEDPSFDWALITLDNQSESIEFETEYTGVKVLGKHLLTLKIVRTSPYMKVWKAVLKQSIGKP
jgi:hypothetical protein